MLDADDTNGSWHLDKRVNISIILVLLGQGLMGAWFAAKMDSRILSTERDIAVLQRRDDERRTLDQRIATDIAALAQAQKATALGVERIERVIDARRSPLP